MGQIFNNFNRPHHGKQFIEKPDPFIAMNTYDELGEIRSRTGIAIRDLDQRMDDFIGEINTTVDAGKIDITAHTDREIVRITNHTNGKIVEITDHTNIKKIEINTLTTEKKAEIVNLTNSSKGEISTLTTNSKNEISTLTINSKKEISDLRDSSLSSITSHTDAKKVEITNHTNTKKAEITDHTDAKKVELDNYTKTKETQLNTYTNTKQTQLDNYTKTKETQLNDYTTVKKTEITNHTNTKIVEITDHTDAKKVEITTHTNTKKAELDTYEKTKEQQIEVFVTGKKEEITSHTDAELERIAATGINTKLDVEVYATDKANMEAEINKKLNIVDYNSDKTTIENNISALGAKTITAGKGLIGGGNLNSSPTLNVVSADEGIIVNDDNIKLNVVDNLTEGGVKKALSAEQGKVLKQLIDTLGTGGALQLLRTAQVFSSYDYLGELPANGTSIMVGTMLYKPTLYLDGTRMDKTQYDVDLNNGLITMKFIYSEDYPVVWVVEDEAPHHIKFAYSTMNMLVNAPEVISKISLGDVIEILGESDADDGGHYLVKCENTAKLNAIDIGGGRFLNEIPNTKITDVVTQVNQNKNDILSKFDKAGGVISGDVNLNQQLIMKDGYACRFQKKDNSTHIWMLGTVNDKFYAFENGYDVDIRGKVDFINNPEINNQSPYMELNNGSTQYGYVGFGSATGVMQIVNRYTGKALDLHTNGTLRYDGQEVTNMSHFNYSQSINGYSKLPSNMIIQKGTHTFASMANGAQVEATINLPIAFTSGNDYMVVTDTGVAFTPTSINCNHHTKRTSNFILRCSQNSGSVASGITVDWIAIGY